MTKVKGNSSKPNKDNQFELIDLDLVKSEPEEVTSSPATTTSVAKIHGDVANQEFAGNPIVIAPQVTTRTIGKTVPVALNVPAGTALQQGNYTLTGGQPSKTFLLINKCSGVQSMLIGGNAVRSKPFSSIIESSQLPQIRVRTCMGMQTIVSNTGPKTSSLVVAQKQGESGVSGSAGKLTADGITAARLCSNASEFQSRPISTVRDIMFTSRSIDADGTVKTMKEYLCNFCQFKVSDRADFEAHKSTHTFSCNHCSFKALSRFDVLKHKKEKHPNCSEELAGYQDLDKLIEAVNAVGAMQMANTFCSSQMTPGIPTQAAVDPPRLPSPDPPHLEMQSVVHPSVVPVETCQPQVGIGNNASSLARTASESEERPPKGRQEGSEPAKSSGKASTGSSSDVRTADDPTEASRTRSARPRRAVTEKKPTLREIDSDSQGDFEANQSDDDDWEEKLPKSSGRKKARREGGKSILRNPEDPNERSPEAQRKQGPVTKYRCTTCSFETTDGTILSEHLKVHENQTAQKMASGQGKIARDPNNARPVSESIPSVSINWSCFYCNLLSDSQATIVGHVVKSHPGKPIQVKRISVPNPPGVIQRLGQNPTVHPPSDAIGASPAAGHDASSAQSRGIAQVQGSSSSSNQVGQFGKQSSLAQRSKVQNPDNEGCLWGCYYCSVQSIERSEVIAHLKKEHPDVKLIVTRRRITHIPATLKPVKAVGKDGVDGSKSMGGENADDPTASQRGVQSNGGEMREGATPMSEKEEEGGRGRPAKRKLSGAKKKKSLVNLSVEPRVLRSRRVSPGSTSPSHREGSPSHASVNSSEGMVPLAKKRKIKADEHDRNSHSSMSTCNMECPENDGRSTVEENSDKPSGKANAGSVRKIQDYPKSAAIKSLAEEVQWKCSHCDFKVATRVKVVHHVTKNHPDRPIRFHRVFQGRILDSSMAPSACSKLRGPRCVREMNLLKNGNWLWLCPLCHRKHVSKGYLNVHIKVAHPKQCPKGNNPFPLRKSKLPSHEKPRVTRDCSVSLVRAEDMVHYDSLCNVLLDNGHSLIKALDVDEDLECDVNRHRKYKCGRCDMRGFRLTVVKAHFLESHPGAGEVMVIDLKKSQGNGGEGGGEGEGRLVYSCLRGDCGIFTGERVELESHYDNFPDHARVGGLRPRRDFGDPIALADGNDSEVTLDADGGDDDDDYYDDFNDDFDDDEGEVKFRDDKARGLKITDGGTLERSEPRWRSLERVESPADGRVGGIGQDRHPVTARISIPDVPQQTLISTLTPSMVVGHDQGQKNSPRAVFLTPKSSDIVTGLSLLKRTLNTPQVMSDVKRLNKSNGSEDQQPQQQQQQQQPSLHPTDVDSRTARSGGCVAASTPEAAGSSPSEFGDHDGSIALPVNQQIHIVQSPIAGRAGQRRQQGEERDDGQFKYTVDGRLLKKPRRCGSPKYVDRYQCVICGHRMGQLDQMKQHLVSCHDLQWKDKAFCIDVRARELRKRQKILFCQREECSFYCKNDLELASHSASPRGCPLLFPKPGFADHFQSPGEFVGFSCFDPSRSKNDEGGTNGSYHQGGGEEQQQQQQQQPRNSWNRSASSKSCNKSYQCSYCTFTTLDLASVKNHVASQHKHEAPNRVSSSSSSSSTTLAFAARRAGFSEIATKLTSDGNFVTSVNDGRIEGDSNDDGDNEAGVDDDNSAAGDKGDYDVAAVRHAMKRPEVCTFGAMSENGATHADLTSAELPATVEDGKTYTVL